MKIAIISTVTGPYSWAGSEEMWKLLGVTSLRAGHSVAVSLYDGFADYEELEDFRRLGGVVIPRSQPSWIRRRFISKGLTGRFSSIATWTPDIIITSGPPAEPYRQPDLREFLSQTQVPTMHIIQGNHPSFISGEEERNQLSALYEKAARIVCVSDENARLLRRQLASRLPNLEVIPNPIRTRLSEPLRWDESEPMRMATVGRYEIWSKCQDLTLEALSGEVWRDRNWMLNLYGNGPDEPYLKRLISYYGLEDKVVLAGFERDFKKIWEKNHLHVLNSNAEGLALALVESMFCGRPALVTRSGGNYELVRNGHDGWVSPGDNVEAISETLETAWLERKNWKEMGTNAFSRVTNWVPEELGGRLLDLVQKVKCAH